MRTTLLILTIGLFEVNGCQNSKNSNADNEVTLDSLKSSKNLSNNDSVRDEDSFHRYDIPMDSDTTTILYRKNFTHEFSDNIHKDSFNIYLKGKTILGGQIKIEIKNALGRIIYSESFRTNNIWDITMYDSTTQAKEKYVLSFIDNSFNEKRFFSPVIEPTDLFIEDYSNKKIWDELKADKTAIGFIYSAGYESGRKIAYVKSLKRAVIYFECC